MIVGTAGHIDHGKTTLVRALTGVDTDRLPEERARGMSIELGFAYLDLPDGHAGEHIGFIDVPGHERLVHTMLAGASGIDFALLLVAADDGVMPQTREHVAVLSLLGLRRGAVAVTKIDRVPAARVAEVRAEAAALLARTPLAGAPVLAVSSLSGEGLDALRRLLFSAAGASRSAPMPALGPGEAGSDEGERLQPAFRLAIDRAFSLAGPGTVVTGRVHAGRLRIGQALRAAPPGDGAPAVAGGEGGPRARVRSLHAQNRAVAEAGAGDRCAVGLAGVGRDDVPRGRWLVDPDIAVATVRLDAVLTLWQGETRPLRSGTSVHVHLGTGDCLGTVTVLRTVPPGPGAADAANDNPGALPLGAGDGVPAGPDLLAPGGQAIVQIVLRQPVAAWRGDRIVLRDASASRTLGGGTVLDPFAPARYRRSAERLAELAAWLLPTPLARLAGLIASAPLGVSLRRWALTEGLASDSVSAFAAGSPSPSPQTPLPLPPDTLVARDSTTGDWALGSRHRNTLAGAALDALHAFHAREPELLGPDAGRWRRLAAPRLPVPLWRVLIAGLQQEGRVSAKGAYLHLPAHGLRLSATDERLAQRIAPMLADAGFEGCWARDLARAAGETEALMRTTLARLAQRGELHQVVRDLCYPAATVARLAAQVRAIAAASDAGAVTAAGFRDATGLGRKRAIQILEYFDRIGFLRRVGDSHRLQGDSDQFPASAA